jgi:hypothetical protein
MKNGMGFIENGPFDSTLPTEYGRKERETKRKRKVSISPHHGE